MLAKKIGGRKISYSQALLLFIEKSIGLKHTGELVYFIMRLYKIMTRINVETFLNIKLIPEKKVSIQCEIIYMYIYTNHISIQRHKRATHM